ncbi:hypothetical protein TREMEDRAFT_62481 [Tremella mesenterica DSM 1558]|uniref:uncharacterized protein n=1 Tax=Tremella mesenterica (strain ATCC 24925 / CBS 8224 / DSM 1558 / NBRC 9311 / NRRL Y-6157 / RJB 2259-6 / UBC 559-6) TaxID=578456 RepID=UPI0003F49FD8|nr:uncharacterized protein TREMEDRAFT_62481 [Tremella mesenterica DSM 1558]XP_007006224.1 uncharacterized protein TREMEDRAFT_63977 [Tremella mesenterica DSM 1558]EIW68086.1 hypothetical protein TREMEDRAFT_63977 [Tremella mesenterica DSM 1558]EIW69612.1 hypothetical protein TREMEDRAFT_62481 [Tremella mesenterica DSM 1558]
MSNTPISPATLKQLVTSKPDSPEWSAKFDWDGIVAYPLRKWSDTGRNEVLRVAAGDKGPKIGISPNESSKYKNYREAYNHAVSPNSHVRMGTFSCQLCQVRQNREELCSFGCVTVGELPTGACTECIARGTTARCTFVEKAEYILDQASFAGNMREELGKLKAIEIQAELATTHNYQLEPKTILYQCQHIRSNIEQLMAIHLPDMAPEGVVAPDTPRKRRRAPVAATPPSEDT